MSFNCVKKEKVILFANGLIVCGVLIITGVESAPVGIAMCHVYVVRIKQFSSRGIFRKRTRSGTRARERLCHPITLRDGSVFCSRNNSILAIIYPFSRSLLPPLLRRFFLASLRHLCHEPVAILSRVHISGRIASRKNYNCIKDVPPNRDALFFLFPWSRAKKRNFHRSLH